MSNSTKSPHGCFGAPCNASPSGSEEVTWQLSGACMLGSILSQFLRCVVPNGIC